MASDLRLYSEYELALLSDEEIVDYAKKLKSRGTNILHLMKKPESKFHRRLTDLREGRDPDKENPKRKPRSAYRIPKGVREVMTLVTLPP